MAANRFVVLSPSEVECYNSDAPKTILAVVAGANIAVKVLGWSVAFDGTSVTSSPITVEFARQTTSGTMSSTSGSKLSTNSETLQASGNYNATVEPVKDVILDTFNIHPQSGIDVKYPEGEQPIIAAGEYIGIIVNAGFAVNCSAKIICEE